MKKFFSIFLPLMSFVGFFLGTAIYTREVPLKWDDAFHRPVEIKLLEVTPEKATFRWGIWDFYLEGNSPSVGKYSGPSLILRNQDGTYCISSVSKSMDDGMKDQSEPGAACFRDVTNVDDRLLAKWARVFDKTIHVTPTWSSQ